MHRLLLPIVLLLSLSTLALAQETRLLCGFEQQADLALVSLDPGAGTLSEAHVTQGQHSLRVSPNAVLDAAPRPQDWSGYDALELDVFVDVAAPMSVEMVIGDKAWQEKPTYWNRHNSTLPLRPGANTISIPLGGLYRGEAGSRGNDLKSGIDVSQIVRGALAFHGPEQGALYLDNLRLTRASRPEGVMAFDFGPADQSVAPGFTAVAPDAVYAEARGWGWDPATKPAAAYDVTFPTRLLQDSIEFGKADFRVHVPPGRYHVVVFFEPLGYWDGEAAQYDMRTLSGRGWEATESTGKWGKLDFVYHFQDTEPLPGSDLWATYLAYLFSPVETDVVVSEGGFDLKVEADGRNATRVAALILYPQGQAEGQRWVAEVKQAQQTEFRARAVELAAPETPNPAPVTKAEREQGFVLFTPSLEDTVYFTTQPTAKQLGARLRASVARGETRALTLALRPLRELGPTRLEVSDLRGKAGLIPKGALTMQVVRHLPTRAGEGISYRVTPRYLVKATEVTLPAGLTRQLWLSVHVPTQTKPGEYRGTLTLRPVTGRSRQVPIEVTVLPFVLDEADFTTAFWGIEPNVPLEGAAYQTRQRQVFHMLLDRGLTSFTGGPSIGFQGLDATGAPGLDFAAADVFMAAARKAGFHREFDNYGGLVVTGLASGYEKGETGAALEQRYGVPYQEIVGRVFAAVQAHATQQHWLPFLYNMCDEPRVLATAQRLVEQMRLFKQASPWLRTCGAFSVSFRPTEDPMAKAEQDIFRALDASVLNGHDASVMAEAKRLGKQVYIYNQGRSRYSFGAYQWSERAKGVKGRFEWISFIRHGYEYFDLDGREPDPSMIFFASDGLRPALAFEQSAEGLNDFRYLQTLDHLAAKAEKLPGAAPKQAAREARAFLAGITDRITVGEREKPGWLDQDAMRAEAGRRIVGLVVILSRARPR